MKKVIAVSLSLVLMLGIVTGCNKKAPDKNETQERVERLVRGEDFKLKGGDDGYYTVYSKDRDLEFKVWWSASRDYVLPNFYITNGEYDFNNDYDDAIHNFWNDEYRKCIDQYGFNDVDYGHDADDNCSPKTVWIYMNTDSDPEDIEKVESLLRDIRDICKKENEYHTSDFDFTYSAYLVYRVGEKEYQQADFFKINKDLTDSELKLDNFKFPDRTTTIGPSSSGNGVAVIKVYEN